MARSGPKNQASLVRKIARISQRTYAADYLGFLLLLTAYMLMQSLMEPFHRMFSLDDLRISYPHALVERVSVPFLFIYAGAVPLVCMVAWALAGGFDGHKFHVTILGFFISLILTSFITDVIKNAVGRPRPDLIDRCKPDLGTPGHALVTISVCTEVSHHTLHDGWRSFPSGHSSFSFAGLGYLSLFFCGQLSVFRPSKSSFAHVLLAIAPILGASLIAISRLEDYRHDVFDVIAGSSLGSVVTWAIYRRYYPGLTYRLCNNPYRDLKTDENDAQRKRRDEELGTSEFRLDDLENGETDRMLGSTRDRSEERP